METEAPVSVVTTVRPPATLFHLLHCIVPPIRATHVLFCVTRLEHSALSRDTDAEQHSRYTGLSNQDAFAKLNIYLRYKF